MPFEPAEEVGAHEASILPQPVVAELLSAQSLTSDIREMLVPLPMLDIGEGYWARRGLHAQIVRCGFRPRLADALIAQSCLDHDLTLITRDRDFGYFSRHAGLRISLPDR